MRKIFIRVMIVLAIIFLVNVMLSLSVLLPITNNMYKGYTESYNAEVIHAYVSQNFKYIPDKVDYWQSPFITVVRRGGDCEDLAILEWSLFKLSGLDASLIFGTYHGKPHFWVEYQGLWEFDATGYHPLIAIR